MELQLFVRMLLRDESGVTSIEYALMGALIAMAILVGTTSLGLNLRLLFEMVAGRVQDVVGGT
ncbi:MAG: Flp family type IVb pilin [Thiobacillus sp.]|uniref:Flp family type IVb pilin n=1 Tax=Thiobacillus sp. TaxID=924 RepID=UPI0028958C21|nr:Flp family type IVb pilin [Thiobacillus sp.]MDT3708245.1 Flp family type IVb pilin [Thiobacillus sp.]